MKTIKTFAILMVMLFISKIGYAQPYSSAVGLRFGFPTSVSYKKFLSSNKAFEGYVGLRSYAFSRYINVNAALQFHNPIASVDNLSWYWGAGGGIFLWSFDSGFSGADDGSFGVAVQGYLGLDYKFDSIPLNLSIDWVPSFFLTGYGSGFSGDYGALSARYILGGGGK